MEINKKLAQAAAVNGICAEWHERLLNTDDIERMLDMYLKGIDFCLMNEYPANDFIRRHFKGKMEHRGIHLDDEFVANNVRKVVALGECKGTVVISGHSVSEIFAKHKSKLYITVTGNSFAMIDMFDNTEVDIVAKDSARVVINKYGGIISHSAGANAVVKVNNKDKKTY